MIGIFEGQRAKNIKLILQSLLTGPKTAKEIAEFIYLKPCLPGARINSNEVKSIESIITRKKQNGAIPVLESKKYIARVNDKWDLTQKGSGVAMMLFNVGQLFSYLKDETQSFFVTYTKSMLESPFYKDFERITLKNGLLDKEKRGTAHSLVTTFPLVLQFLQNAVNELASESLDIDEMSNEDFMSRIQFRMAFYSFNIMYGDQIQRAMRFASSEYREDKAKREAH
jgi:hypothetical protein